jgi:hypothetical protein
MTTELPGTTALARVRNLGYTLPEQGPADSKYVAYQRLDSSIYIAANCRTSTASFPGRGWSAVT